MTGRTSRRTARGIGTHPWWTGRIPSTGFVVLLLALTLVVVRSGSAGPASGSIVHDPTAVVGAAARPTGGGWSVRADGLVTATGGAPSYGDVHSLTLKRPIVGMAATLDGGGYWLVASDGGIFSCGDAGFYGSTGSLSLNQPIVSMAATRDGRGYWLVASDGGIFAFGDAGFYGSMGNYPLNQPIVGMAATPSGRGYWLVASDGGIFAIGDAGFLGAKAGTPGYQAAAITTRSSGYLIVSTGGSWSSFGSTSATHSGGTTAGNHEPTTSTTTTTTTPTTTTTSTTPAPPPVGCSSQARPAGDTAPIPCVSGNALVDSTGATLRLLGVNASGTQDACIQNKGFGWGTLNSVEAANIASWHTNVVRVPLNEDCWLGINGVPAAYSGAVYQAAIARWVQALNGAGLAVILELYSAAPGSYPATGQWPMADADHSISFWSQVAATFAKDPSVIFDLFNESMLGRSRPTDADWGCWQTGCITTFAACLPGEVGPCPSCPPGQVEPCPAVSYQTAGMQQLVSAVRASGASQPIMLGGPNWAGDPCGLRDSGGNGGQCEWMVHRPHDAEGQLIASLHTYNWTPCSTISCWQSDVAQVASSVPVVTGELGESDCSSSYMSAFMAWADQGNVSYLANSWEPPGPTDPTHCVATSSGSKPSGINLRLLSTWDGKPNSIAPEGAAFQAHLASLAPGG